MGEVYRATDKKLDREVAIKVLPQSVAQDKERLARFEREAKVLAQLNHPNIATVYGLEQSGETRALILELVEGDDLSVRLKRGPLPVDEALEVCKQIAEALEAAHEKGIIHRDLKPGNIKLTEDGKVKVLDFGLAKALEDEPSTSGVLSVEDSPTITDAFTKPGTILGTAAYMSPEQARGKHVDKRTDIWAFGCVIFECLTGKKAFQGEDVTDTLARIIQGNPAWSALPPGIPSTIQLLLRKCLSKDRKKRLQHIDDARLDLEYLKGNVASCFENRLDHASPSFVQTNTILRWVVTICLFVLFCITTFFLGRAYSPGKDKSSNPILQTRMDLGIGDDTDLNLHATTLIKLSPDGSKLGFIAGSPQSQDTFSLGVHQGGYLYLRSLNQLNAQPHLSAGVIYAFCFSPEGDRIAFVESSELRRIRIIKPNSGEVRTLCETQKTVFGIEWTSDDWIIYGQGKGEIKRVSADRGGESQTMTVLQQPELVHRFPCMMPTGNALLYSVGNSWGSVGLIKVQPIPEGDSFSLGLQGHHVRYLSSGHLIYLDHTGSIYGVGFDPNALKVLGKPKLLIEGIEHGFGSLGHMDVSSKGDLVFVEDQKDLPMKLVWVDREGKSESAMEAGFYFGPRISPDGRSMICFDENDQIMLYDLKRKTPTRLTEDYYGHWPLWSPNGESVFWGGGKRDDPTNGPSYLLSQSVGKKSTKELHETSGVFFPMAWQPRGNRIVCFTETLQGGDLVMITMRGDDDGGWIFDGDISGFQTSPASEDYPCFSPDGNWVAFTASDDQETHLWVCHIDGTRLTKVSNHQVAAATPYWTEQDELIYMIPATSGLSGEYELSIVQTTIKEQTISFGNPELWKHAISHGVSFSINPEGSRVLIHKREEGQKPVHRDHIVLFQNFEDYVRTEIPLE